MTDDPNVPQEPQEPAAPAEPAPPQIDLDAAYNAVAEAEGYDPRIARYEFNELKRKREEFERERREFERERSSYRPPQPDYNEYDPVSRRIMERLDRMESLERERTAQMERDREDRERAQEQGSELYRAYVSQMRQAGATPDQIEANRDAFFNDAMVELYPEGIPGRLGVEGAVRNTLRFFRSGNSNGSLNHTPSPTRDRRAAIFIPGTAPSQAPAPSDDGGPQRPNESLEEYVMRRRKWREENRVVPSMQDGVRYSSE